MNHSEHPLRLALIGPGAIGKVWAKAFAKTPQVRLSAVAGLRVEDAEQITRDFEGAKPSAKWKEVIADPEVDAIVVATPHALLAEMSTAALQAGKHVLCEKPAGIAIKEIQKAMAAAKRKKRVYMIGFNHRYHPAYIKAREVVKEGRIGKILSMRMRYGFGGRPGYNKEWRFNRKISGGGHLMDQGIHLIDLARTFVGDFKDVKGFAENLYWGGSVEDNGFLLLRTKSHQVVQLHASITNWDWIHSTEIFGTKGYLTIDGLDSRYRGPERLTIGTVNPQSTEFPKEEVIAFADERKEDSFARQLAVFCDAVQRKKTAYPGGQDAIQALKIIHRIYRQR